MCGAIEEMVAGYGTTAAYYAHASAGCLHIRPLINLKEQRGVEIMKEMADAGRRDGPQASAAS